MSPCNIRRPVLLHYAAASSVGSAAELCPAADVEVIMKNLMLTLSLLGSPAVVGGCANSERVAGTTQRAHALPARAREHARVDATSPADREMPKGDPVVALWDGGNYM